MSEKINCKLRLKTKLFLSSVVSTFMVAAYIKKIMYNMIYVTDVYSSEIINMFFVGQVSGLVENSNLLKHYESDKCQILHDGITH